MFAQTPRYLWACLLVVIAGDLMLATTAFANHPFHVATAETRWNMETKKLEVSIRCHPIDLETALRRRTGKKIDLDTTENVDELLADYLRETFQLQQGPLPASSPAPAPSEALNAPSQPATPAITDNDKESKTAKLHWVGKEIDMKWAWLYVELEPADLTQELHMTNTILMDVLDDQSNTVIIRLGTQRQSLMFHHKKRTLPFPRPSEFVKQPE